MAAYRTEALLPVLAVLRGQYFTYTTAHWQTNGHAFYGNHLLFQRLYESVAEDVDAMAEKMVGLDGDSGVDPSRVLQVMGGYVRDWEASFSCPFERALRAEEDLQEVVKKAYEGLKAVGEITLGLDDFLMSLASKHETNTYLIKQVFPDHPMEHFASWTFAEVPK